MLASIDPKYLASLACLLAYLISISYEEHTSLNYSPPRYLYLPLATIPLVAYLIAFSRHRNLREMPCLLFIASKQGAVAAR